MSDLRGTLQDAARGSALSQPKVFVLVTPPPPTSPRDKPPPDVASMMARHHVPLMEDTLARLCVITCRPPHTPRRRAARQRHACIDIACLGLAYRTVRIFLAPWHHRSRCDVAGPVTRRPRATPTTAASPTPWRRCGRRTLARRSASWATGPRRCAPWRGTGGSSRRSSISPSGHMPSTRGRGSIRGRSRMKGESGGRPRRPRWPQP